MADIYSVKNISTNKIVETGFDKKADAKAKRDELCKTSHDNWTKKVKDDKDLAKPFPYIVTKGKEHPKL
jgi:hypothetical protein